MKKFALAVTFISLLLSSVLAKAGADKPDWVDNWRTIYPDSTYIAQLGKAPGKSSEKDAKADAANAISQYIKTNVQSELLSSLKTSSGSNDKGRLVTTSEKSNSQTIKLSVDVALSGLEFTEPWYCKKEKIWYCVAYVPRKKAYEAFKPTLQDRRNNFLSLYEKAEKEKEPLLKCSFYKAAFNSGKNFKDSYDFGILLDSNAVKADFAQDRENLNGVPAKIKEIILQSPMKVRVAGDYGNNVCGMISKVFSDIGFVVQGGMAVYLVEAEINDNDAVFKLKTKETHTLIPSVSLRIKSQVGKTLYSFDYKTEKRTTNFTRENAQRDAFPAFATEVGEALKVDFNEKLGVDDFDLLF